MSKVHLISFQEQASKVQTQLNEEEMKNSRLVQQIAKLEEQISVLSQQCDHKDEVRLPVLTSHYAVASFLNCCTECCAFNCAVLMQVLSTERANRNTEQHDLQETVSKMQESLQSEQQSAEGE